MDVKYVGLNNGYWIRLPHLPPEASCEHSNESRVFLQRCDFIDFQYMSAHLYRWKHLMKNGHRKSFRLHIYSIPRPVIQY
jgi:hypothetical protein